MNLRTGTRCAVLLVMLAGCGGTKRETRAARPGEPIVVSNVGLATPESVLHDPLADIYYVSNINGSPLDADDNGFISAVSPDGQVVALKWIDGATDSVTLHAPKGMALSGPYLFVTDINVLRRFDRQTGGPRGEVAVPGATFLNDLASDAAGFLYFTDSGLKAGAQGFEPSGTDAVYRMSPSGQLETLARGEALGRPNGIAVTGDSVWVVSFGSGELYRIADGGKTAAHRLPKGMLDGLVAFSGDLFVSSWEGNSLFRGPLGGPFVELLGGLAAPADIGHDLWRHRLLVPLFNLNEVRIVPLAF